MSATQHWICPKLLLGRAIQLQKPAMPKHNLGLLGSGVRERPVNQLRELARDSYVRLGSAGLRPPTRDARSAAPASTPSSTRAGGCPNKPRGHPSTWSPRRRMDPGTIACKKLTPHRATPAPRRPSPRPSTQAGRGTSSTARPDHKPRPVPQ